MQYDPRTGQYRNTNGRFVSRPKILQLVHKEAQLSQRSLTSITDNLLSGKLSLSQWQIQLMGQLKAASLRTGLLAAGGKAQATNRHYGAIGQQLREQYARVDQFATAIAKGELSTKQIRARAKQYGQSSTIAFHAAEKISKMASGMNLAKRTLTLGVKHCQPCIGYATGWVDIKTIVPPGTRCDCFANCACKISYQARLF